MKELYANRNVIHKNFGKGVIIDVSMQTSMVCEFSRFIGWEKLLWKK